MFQIFDGTQLQGAVIAKVEFKEEGTVYCAGHIVGRGPLCKCIKLKRKDLDTKSAGPGGLRIANYYHSTLLINWTLIKTPT